MLTGSINNTHVCAKFTEAKYEKTEEVEIMFLPVTKKKFNF